MSCGTPVITSATTSLPEVGGDAAIYIDPEDVQSIQAALELFENGDISLNGIRERSLMQSTRFSWEECVRQTIDVYRTCLGV
jgi:glycosyltransferase involved in cell wall biosynthesis